MKLLVLMCSLLISQLAFAQSDKCKWADTTVEYVGSTWSLTPQTFYAKEGDKICIKFSSVDTAKTLVIESSPVYLRGYANKPAEEGYMMARKAGSYKVICRGCDKTATLIVQSVEEFNKFQKKLDKVDAYQQRNPHLYKQTQPQPTERVPFYKQK